MLTLHTRLKEQRPNITRLYKELKNEESKPQSKDREGTDLDWLEFELYFRGDLLGGDCQVRALVMTIGLDLPKQILEAQIEALKPENLENEDVGVMIRNDIPKKSSEPTPMEL
ncbi:hypothetical protein Tco_0343141 [Tanacetum coccineum]